MGREIRKVPPNWQHPKDDKGRLKPMFDQTFSSAAAEWKDRFAEWERGERPDYCTGESRNLEFWEWDGEPPTREYYRPWQDSEATWFQLWETVSEGTPISPPFASLAKLEAHLSKHGDDWSKQSWGPAKAKAFCADGYAPSFVMVDGKIMDGPESSLYFAKNRASDN